MAKKLQIENLTPEILTEVKDLANEEEVVAYFAKKGYEVSPELGKRILDGVKAGNTELTEEELEKVSGGCGSSKNSTRS